MMIVSLFLAVFATVAIAIHLLTAEKAKMVQQTRSRLDAIGRAPQDPSLKEELFRREASLSTAPWVDRLLARFDGAAKLRLLLYQAGMNWTVARLLATAALAALLAGELTYIRTYALVPAIAMGALAGYAPFFIVLHKRVARFDRFRQILPEALDLMVAALRAGHGLSSAIGMVAKEASEPVRGEFKQCFDEQNFGVDLRRALLNMAYRTPIHDLRIIVTAVLIQKDTGGNLAEILEKVAHLVREDFRLKRQIQVFTAQGRLTGWILAFLPLGLGFMLYMIHPEYMRLLWTRPMGVKLIYASVAMTLTGGLVIRKIVRFRI